MSDTMLRWTKWFVLVALAATIQAAPGLAGDPQRGYRFLVDEPLVPASFDQETFEQVWRVWPEPLRTEAAAATPPERRRMAFQRYGLSGRPEAPELPLQFVVDGQGNWVSNCFTCHGGQVAGSVFPGAPNNRYAIQTLTEEMRAAKLLLGKTIAPIDYGSLFVPLGGTNGTTNAVIFGIALGARRNPDLTLRTWPKRRKLLHHDMDAPAWWHFSKRDTLYIDGFAPKSHRALMQFALDPVNGPEKFHAWEDRFRDVYAYLESIEPPPYPYPIDDQLADRGGTVFQRHCAECHGSYGPDAWYEEIDVPLEVIGTDRARFDAIAPLNRQDYRESWFAAGDQDRVLLAPEGYVAPPLDGIWASAPYFHNGSVPTLWHLLHPDARPRVWKPRPDLDYDRQRVGLPVDEFDTIPAAGIDDQRERRDYFDTTKFGKSAAGHRFPAALSDDEKRAVLEYLKTL